MIWKKCNYFVLFVFLLTSCSGAQIFKLNGATLSPDVKTFTVLNFGNDAGNGPPNMNIQFTEKLREYFIRNTRLTMVKVDGDLMFEGYIKSFTLAPIAPAANPDGSQQAALQRLTITVTVDYSNKLDDSFDFENKDFSFYFDFSADKAVNQIETEALEAIFGQLVIDIFNGSVANW